MDSDHYLIQVKLRTRLMWRRGQRRMNKSGMEVELSRKLMETWGPTDHKTAELNKK